MAPWQVDHPLCKCRWKGSGKNKQHQRYSQKILLSLSQKQTRKEKYKRLKKSELFSCCSPVKEMHARVNFCFQSMQSPCQAIWNQCKDFGSIWTLNLVFFLDPLLLKFFFSASSSITRTRVAFIRHWLLFPLSIYVEWNPEMWARLPWLRPCGHWWALAYFKKRASHFPLHSSYSAPMQHFFMWMYFTLWSIFCNALCTQHQRT